MKRMLARTVALAATLLVATPFVSRADAKDYCVTDGVDTWIARPFKPPAKDKCKAWHGFVRSLAGGGGGREVCTGTACTSALGDEMRVTMTCASTYASAVRIVAFSIDPVSLTGIKYDTLPDIGPVGGGPVTFTGAVSVLCLASYGVP